MVRSKNNKTLVLDYNMQFDIVVIFYDNMASLNPEVSLFGFFFWYLKSFHLK